MIDVENEVFERVKQKLEVYRDESPRRIKSLGISNEEASVVPSFPHVTLVEVSNVVVTATRDSSNGENHSSILYEVNVYSNRFKGAKEECKEILQVVDKEMSSMGFWRFSTVPVGALDESTKRVVARYEGIVSKNKEVFGR